MTARHAQVIVFRLLAGAVVLACLAAATPTLGAETAYRSSQVQLEGKKAARTHLLLFRGLPPGEHRVRASVHGTNIC